MDSEDADHIEICIGKRDEEAFSMEDRGASLLHYSEAELSASRINMKERRLLNRSWAKLEADRSYRMRCMQTDLRLAELRQTRLEIRSARVRSHLSQEERAGYRRMDAAGKLRLPSGCDSYRRPAHLEPGQLIVSAQRRLNAGGLWTNSSSGQKSSAFAGGADVGVGGVRFANRGRSGGGASDSDDDSETSSVSSASTTESLRRLRVAAAARRPLTAAVAAPTTALQSLGRQRLTSHSCQAAFFTGDLRESQPRPRPVMTTSVSAAARRTPAEAQRDRRRWAEAERRKLRELDRPVREFLRSLAELRV